MVLSDASLLITLGSAIEPRKRRKDFAALRPAMLLTTFVVTLVEDRLSFDVSFGSVSHDSCVLVSSVLVFGAASPVWSVMLVKLDAADHPVYPKMNRWIGTLQPRVNALLQGR